MGVGRSQLGADPSDRKKEPPCLPPPKTVVDHRSSATSARRLAYTAHGAHLTGAVESA